MIQYWLFFKCFVMDFSFKIQFVLVADTFALQPFCAPYLLVNLVLAFFPSLLSLFSCSNFQELLASRAIYILFTFILYLLYIIYIYLFIFSLFTSLVAWFARSQSALFPDLCRNGIIKQVVQAFSGLCGARKPVRLLNVRWRFERAFVIKTAVELRAFPLGCQDKLDWGVKRRMFQAASGHDTIKWNSYNYSYIEMLSTLYGPICWLADVKMLKLFLCF